MEKNRKLWLIILAALAVVYILLRFWHLTDSCLWFDEIFGIHAAEMNWSEMFWFVAQDLIHPPLFYILLKIWIFVVGESLFWLRFFSVLFSILALVPFYFLCRQLKLNYLSITLALAFFACNGALIKYAQEVRMYSLLLFFALFSMWFFSRFLHLGKNIWLLTTVNILLVYTHYFGWFVVLAEVVSILILQRIKWRQILIMFGTCLLSFAPWIFAVFRAAQINADFSQNIGWIPRPFFKEIFLTVFSFVEPFYYQSSSADYASNYFIVIPILLLIGAAKVFYLLNFKKENEELNKQDFWMLSIFFAVPFVLALILSWILPFSIWGTRHLIIVFGPSAIFAASFINSVKINALKYLIVSAIAFLFVAAFILELQRPKQEFIWCAWENLANELYDSTLHGNDASNIGIYTFEDLVAYHFWFALRDSDRGFRVFKVNETENLFEDKAYFLPRGFNEIQKVNFDEINEQKFYIAFRDKEWNPKNPPLKNLIEKGYKVGKPKIFEAQGIKAFLVEIKR